MSDRISLLDGHEGPNSWSVDAYLQAGALQIEGQDLGPATAFISTDGEYEWTVTVRADWRARAVVALGGEKDELILDVLAWDHSGRAAYGVRQKLVDAGIPAELFVWSG